MITLISFFIVLIGAINWLSIGLMQYDFVAGIFGTQSSLLSRIVYILVGFSAIWLVIMAFKQKGRIKLNDNGFKKSLKKSTDTAPQTVEADKDFAERQIHQQNQQNFAGQDYNQNYNNQQNYSPDNKSPFER